MLFFKWLKKTRAARKHLQAQITSHNISTGNFTGRNIREWVQVKDHTIIVHQVTEKVKIWGQRKERVIYIEIEYRNESAEENLSCRSNQWYLFDQNGYRYETKSEFLAPHLYQGKHYFGGDRNISPGMNARGWFAFSVPPDTRIIVLQFMNQFIGTKTANFEITDVVETETIISMPLDLLAEIKENEDAITLAALDFMKLLPNKDLERDLAISAEMAGLKLLRTSQVNLSNYTPGHTLLGAISDETYNLIHRYLYSWSISHGADPRDVRSIKIPNDAKDYIPEVVQFESAFDSICQEYEIQADHVPFVAVKASMELIFACQKKGLIDVDGGHFRMFYHIVVGSKVVPTPTYT